MTQLESVRRGNGSIAFRSRNTLRSPWSTISKEKDLKSPANANPSSRFFERERTYPTWMPGPGTTDSSDWMNRSEGSCLSWNCCCIRSAC